MMPSLSTTFGGSLLNDPLKSAFLKWQCHVRQMSMRDGDGRPSDAVMPEVFLDGETESLGVIITILNKLPGHSATPEMEHMARKTSDPALVREAAMRFLSASYYQKSREFSDILTATFPPGSPGAQRIRRADGCRLVFDAFGQVFDIRVKVWRLTAKNPLHRATIAHNALFNPGLLPDTEVLGFEPDWANSRSDPDLRV